MKLICEIWMGELPHIRSAKVRQFFASFTLTRQNILWIPVGMGRNLMWRETRIWRCDYTHLTSFFVGFVSCHWTQMLYHSFKCSAPPSTPWLLIQTTHLEALHWRRILSRSFTGPPLQCSHDSPYVKRPTTTLRIDMKRCNDARIE